MVLRYTGHQVVALTVSFTVIAGVILGLRLFTRIWISRNAGIEDVCISFAMVCSIALTAMIGEQVRFGMGKHIADLDMSMIIDSLKPFWASVWIYYLGLTFTKISILLQYLRIFPMPKFRIACFAVMGFVCAYSVWNFFGSIFECMPVAYFWDKSIEGGKCMNQFAVWFTNAGANILQDFAIIILPMPVLKSLDLPTRQKRSLMVVFALGGFVCLVSILRLQSLVIISNSTDPTFDNPPAATWSSIETNVGIICACLPSLRHLISRVLPTYFANLSRLTSDEAEKGKSWGSKQMSFISRDARRSVAAKSIISTTTASEMSEDGDGDAKSQVTQYSAPARPIHARKLTFEHAKLVEISSPKHSFSSPKHSHKDSTSSEIGDELTLALKEVERAYQVDRPSTALSRMRSDSMLKPLPATPFPVSLK